MADKSILRLDKLLCDMGIDSRSEVKKLIKSGAVKVDGICIKDSSYKCDISSEITVSGRKIIYQQYIYIMLNKPSGYLSANEDKRDKTVFDLIESDRKKDMFCVGRLDKDTEGLLLLTNDGELSHRLLSPKSHVPKTYYLQVDGILDEEDVKRAAEGITYAGDDYKPSHLEILEADKSAGTSKAKLTIYEGKFHQVKNMMLALGKKVTYLKRLSMGRLMLDEKLCIGEYRELTKEELGLLKYED
ncbi:MAG TPA: 16S rRNA pseudouridine(516) synthase [Eubacterium sp.]|nr:16S rRNA pseudouridine(516) synthase [Eubacterium sp.]